jgi:hypothetical protein
MILHLGNDVYVTVKNIIGIFDLDNTTVSKHTRQFLSQYEKDGKIVLATNDLPKSFVLVNNNNNQVYLSQMSTATLQRRLNNTLSFK